MFVGESGRRSHSISDVSCFLLTLATLALPDGPLSSVVKGIRGHTRTHPRAHKFLTNGSTLGVDDYSTMTVLAVHRCVVITPDGRGIGRARKSALPRSSTRRRCGDDSPADARRVAPRLRARISFPKSGTPSNCQILSVARNYDGRNKRGFQRARG